MFLIVLGFGLQTQGAYGATMMGGIDGWEDCTTGVQVAFQTDYTQHYFVVDGGHNGPEVPMGRATRLPDNGTLVHFRGYLAAGTEVDPVTGVEVDQPMKFGRWIADTVLQPGCYVIRGMSPTHYGGNGYFEVLELPTYRHVDVHFRLGYSQDHWVVAPNRFEEAPAFPTTGRATSSVDRYTGDRMVWVKDPDLGMGFQCGANAIIQMIGTAGEEYLLAKVEAVDGSHVRVTPDEHMVLTREHEDATGQEINWEIPFSLENGCYQMVIHLEVDANRHNSYANLFRWEAFEKPEGGARELPPGGWMKVRGFYLHSLMAGGEYLPYRLGGGVPDPWISLRQKETDEFLRQAEEDRSRPRFRVATSNPGSASE